MEPNWEGILRYGRFSNLSFENPTKIIDSCLSLGYIATCVETENHFCFVAESHNENVICFRGSDSLEDLKTDLGIGFYKTENEWNVHNGFYEAWESLRPKLSNVLDHCDYTKPFVICGHSLGGALALLCAVYLSEFITDIEVCVFGCPRVGRGKWQRLVDERIKYQNLIILNVVNNGDLIPHIPWKIFAWKTVGESFTIGVKKKWYDILGKCKAHPILRYIRNVIIKLHRK